MITRNESYQPLSPSEVTAKLLQGACLAVAKNHKVFCQGHNNEFLAIPPNRHASLRLFLDRNALDIYR